MTDDRLIACVVVGGMAVLAFLGYGAFLLRRNPREPTKAKASFMDEPYSSPIDKILADEESRRKNETKPRGHLSLIR